jgi:hypothetical protein
MQIVLTSRGVISSFSPVPCEILVLEELIAYELLNMKVITDLHNGGTNNSESQSRIIEMMRLTISTSPNDFAPTSSAHIETHVDAVKPV